MKRRRCDDPLKESVDEVIHRLTEWEDACGGKFTIESSITKGIDFVILWVRNVDEVRAADLLDLVNSNGHVVSCHCDFSEQSIVFRFGDSTKRDRHTPYHVNEELLEKEVLRIQRSLSNELDEDIRSIARYVVAVKENVSLLQQATLRFDVTVSPGVMVLTVKKLSRTDAALLELLRGMTERKDYVDIIIFLSPPDSQCLRVRLNKTKRTVNL